MLKRKTLIMGVLPLTLAIFLIVSPVYADIPPPRPPRIDWSTYAIGVIVAETAAWLIGAEFLWRMTRKTITAKREVASRSGIYKIMLFAMLVSFSIGLLLSKTLGWI
jgi:hypothetical protein